MEKIFNAKDELENVVNFVRDYYKKCNLGGAVIGLSGGKDSGVALGVLVKALGSENVVAVTLPCHSGEDDKLLAEKVAEHFGVKTYNFDLTNVNDEFEKSFEKTHGKLNKDDLKNSNINLKPRLRMAGLYYYSAMLSSVKKVPYLVAGTSNKCELYVGYFTKGGDQVCDIAILSSFTVSEVIEIGKELGVPESVLFRAPSDGLSGQTDEDKLGVTYADIEKVINGTLTSGDVYEKIQKMHAAASHKFSVPAYQRKENC